MSQPPLILGSSSRYRADLLRRLGLDFEQVAPYIDESPRHGETPTDLVVRLARDKARAICELRPEAWVIASDQLAALEDRATGEVSILGKPGDAEATHGQLRRCAGNSVTFLTSVCVQGGAIRSEALDRTIVSFRALGDAEIERYVAAEQPFDCAGGFKAEGLGIALFDRLESTDPTAIIGLPLITVARLLRQAGFTVP